MDSTNPPHADGVASEALTAVLRRTLTLVDRSTRWRAVGMLAVIVFGVLLETLGIGMVFPFIKLLIDPGEIRNMAWLGKLLPVAGDAVDGRVLIPLTAGLLGLFVAKNLVLLVVYHVQARFTLANMRLLALRLYGYYLNGPYALHLARNSADLIQNIHSACTSAFVGSFMGFLTLASELLLIVILLGLLIVIEPVTTLVAGVAAGGGTAAFYLVFQNRIRRWGERTLNAEKSILKSLQQGLHSIKEVKVLGREKFVLDDYRRPLDDYVRLLTIKQVITQAPRLWVETLTVCTVLGVILYILMAGQTARSFLPILTLFTAAALRMIPSMNRMLIALNRINDAKFAVDIVHRDLSALRSEAGTEAAGNGANFTFSNLLRVEGVSFRYPSTGHPALNNVDLSIRRGESVGLVGPSGAGKTTLVDIVLGLLKPTAGRIVVDGTDVAAAPRAWRKHVGYVPQAIYLIDDSLRRNIALGLDDHEIDESAIANATRFARIDEFIAELPKGLDTTVGDRGVRLSGGQRQRVGIARALYNNPDVLIFDEATSSLDSETEHEINNAIERLSADKTVIIIAHRLSTVRQCDRLVYLDGGRVVDVGTFEELTARNDTFRNLVELAKL